MTAVVDVQGVTLDYRLRDGSRVRALDGVSVAVRPGECVAVMGASGSGKSSLALVMAGLLEPASGLVHPRGRDRASGQTSAVLQRAEAALVGATVGEDVGWAMQRLGVPAAVRRERITSALTEVGLPPDMVDRSPYALSGGEQRRAIIAGALAMQSPLLVLDEPTGGLDARAASCVHRAMVNRAQRGAAVVFVTHDAEEAAGIASRLVVMRGGRIAFDGDPASLFVDPLAAAAVGIDAPARSRLAHHLASGLNSSAAAGGGGTGGTPEAGWLLRRLTTGPRTLGPLARLAAFVLLVVAAFAASSVAGMFLAATAAAFAVGVARVPASRLVRMLRPFAFAFVVLAVLQIGFGETPTVTVLGNRTVESDLLWLVGRWSQILALLLGSLALTHRIDAVELADGLGVLLAPLRLLRVPVDEFALVLAIGLAFVPTIEADMRSIELAQRARVGGRVTVARRFQLQMASIVPLFVHSVRRSRHLADTLHVRAPQGLAMRRRWSPMPTSRADVLAPLAGTALVALAVVL